MSDDSDLWEVRDLPAGLTLELWGSDQPTLVLVQGENRTRVELSPLKTVTAALADAAADLAATLAAERAYDA